MRGFRPRWPIAGTGLGPRGGGARPATLSISTLQTHIFLLVASLLWTIRAMAPEQSGARSRAIPDGSSSRAVGGASTTKTPTDFLWVNQDEDSQDRTAARAKQAFIRTRYHRRKKEIQLQNLKTVKPFPTDTRVVRSQEGLVPIAHTPVVGQATNLDILDGVLSLSLHTDQNTNLYFHHCEYYKYSFARLPL